MFGFDNILCQKGGYNEFKNIVEKFGIIDTEERAFELYNLLIEEGIDSVDTKGFFSYQLIDELGKTELI